MVNIECPKCGGTICNCPPVTTVSVQSNINELLELRTKVKKYEKILCNIRAALMKHFESEEENK